MTSKTNLENLFEKTTNHELDAIDSVTTMLKQQKSNLILKAKEKGYYVSNNKLFNDYSCWALEYNWTYYHGDFLSIGSSFEEWRGMKEISFDIVNQLKANLNNLKKESDIDDLITYMIDEIDYGVDWQADQQFKDEQFVWTITGEKLQINIDYDDKKFNINSMTPGSGFTIRKVMRSDIQLFESYHETYFE